MKNVFIRLAIFHLLLFTFLSKGISQPVNIPDPALRAVVERTLDKNAGETITQSEMSRDTFTILSANNHGITDLTGLEYATALEILFLQENSIRDITALANLDGLTNLYLSHNHISDISPISNIIAIHTLLLNNNELTSLDNLPDLSSATILQFQHNQITDLEPLINHTELNGDGRTLNLEGNPLDENSVDNHIPTLLFSRHLDVKFTSRILNKVSGNNQTAEINTRLQPFVVEVIDHKNSKRSSEKIVFELLDGSGYFDNVPENRDLTKYSTTTDVNGRASAIFTTGTTTGKYRIAVQLHKKNADSLIVIGTSPFVITVSDLPSQSSQQIIESQTPQQQRVEDVSTEESQIEQTSELQEDEVNTRQTATDTPPSLQNRLSYKGQISFSEIMYITKVQQHTLPQWIELFNSSDTETINLNGWKLSFYLLDENGQQQHNVITIDDMLVFPKQTVIFVTKLGRCSEDIHLDRVYELDDHHIDVFDFNESEGRILGKMGFYLMITDPDGMLSDVAGNLDVDGSTIDKPAWRLPSGMTSNDARTSLIRRYGQETDLPLNGTLSNNWKRACELNLAVVRYWGKVTDVGNPGYRGTRPLPVTLSYFSAVKSELGACIKWITESELDNVGFNLLRSQSRQGPYVKVNPRLIQGAGTTGERSTYRWTDSTAIPNVEYFYQIEDVSITGKRNTLTTIRMKGIITPKARLITRWGQLKIR